MSPAPPTRIFLSYAHEDGAIVRSLYDGLSAAGFAPWLDEENLLPGQEWEQEINRSMSEADFLVLCLSLISISKQGYIQTEMSNALALISQRPQYAIYLIPVRLENCEIPKSLASKQTADLFKPNGLDKLIKAIKLEVARRAGRPAMRTAKADAIGFTVDSQVQKSVELMNLAMDRIWPNVRASADAQHELSTGITKLSGMSSRFAGRISDDEMLRRLEYSQRIIDSAIKLSNDAGPVYRFMPYLDPDVGIGPGNVDEVRAAVRDLFNSSPVVIKSATNLLSVINSAKWLPVDLSNPLIQNTEQIKLQADIIRKEIAGLGQF